MQLTRRLQEIADRVPKDSYVVDVGTDHGYIPIYLTRNNLCKKCIASDVNQGPLDSARKHSLKYNITNLDLRKGSGLQTIKQEDGIEVVIIAGMGGLLIIDILRKDLEIVKGAKKLILQPQTNIAEVRKFLHSIGWMIEEETFLKDEGKYYTIISTVKGEEAYDNEWEYLYGKHLLHNPNETFREWMEHRETVFDKIYKGLEQADEQQREQRQAQLEEEHRWYKEARACMQ